MSKGFYIIGGSIMKRYLFGFCLVVFTLVIFFNFKSTTGVSYLGSAVTVGSILASAFFYVLFLRKKDELQKYILYQALSSSFVGLMGSYFALTIINSYWKVKVPLFPWMVVLTGIIVFVISLVLVRLNYRVKNRNEK